MIKVKTQVCDDMTNGDEFRDVPFNGVKAKAYYHYFS